MLCITVAQDGSGDFASISEAVLAVPYDCPAQIRIGAGIYREKLVCEKKDIALQGAGADHGVCAFVLNSQNYVFLSHSGKQGAVLRSLP